MKNFLKSFIVILLLSFGWHILANSHVIDAEFFPSPFHVLNNLIQLITQGAFLKDIEASFLRLLISALITIPLSLILALLCVQIKIFDILFRPIVAFTYPLPKVAIIPLLMLIFGIGDKTKIAVISLGMFYLLFINLYTSMNRLKSSTLNDVATIFKISSGDYLFHFLIKGVFVDFLVGLKLALGYALTLIVVSEFSMSKNGIGNFIWKSWDQFKVLDMYSGVLFLCLAGFVIYFILDVFINRTTKYFNR